MPEVNLEYIKYFSYAGIIKWIKCRKVYCYCYYNFIFIATKL